MKTAIRILFFLLSICSFILFAVSGQPVVSIIFITAIIAVSYGCACILVSWIPMSFSHKNIVSTLIGIFDFSSYIGAAFSSTAFGYLLASGEWDKIPLIWGVMAVIGLVLAVKFTEKKRRR